MPITPLHCGVMAPVNHYFPNRVSNISFVLANLWIDTKSIQYALTGEGGIDHGNSHSLAGVLIVGTLIAMPGVRSAKWVLGAYLGALTHLFLDALVHPEIQMLPPLTGNPLYIGHMGIISLILLPLTAWFIQQNVSYARRYVIRTWTAHFGAKSPPDA